MSLLRTLQTPLLCL